MTYQELLNETAKKKEAALIEVAALTKENPLGWALKDIYAKRLARGFIKAVAENVGELIDATGDIDSLEAREIGDIFVAYEECVRMTKRGWMSRGQLVRVGYRSEYYDPCF